MTRSTQIINLSKFTKVFEYSTSQRTPKMSIRASAEKLQPIHHHDVLWPYLRQNKQTLRPIKLNSCTMIQFVTVTTMLMVSWLELLGASSGVFADAFALYARLRTRIALEAGKSSWGIGDDWSSLSNENPENTIPDTDDIFDEDLARQAAKRMEYSPKEAKPLSKEEKFINDAVDEVHNHGLFHSQDDPSLYDTGFESYTQTVSFLDEMGEQISMLVHCNERPEEMLVQEGRALAPLSEEERNDVTQLVTQSNESDEYEMTDFFRESVSKMFHQHARSEQDEEGNESHTFLDAAGVAEWMTQCLGSDKHGKITQHDRRVLSTMSTYATYGTGKMELEDFERLYLKAVTDFLNGKTIKTGRDKKMELPTVDSVWRDIRNHGLLAPVEQERQRLAEEIRQEFGAGNKEETKAKGKLFTDTLLDECEIIEWKEDSKVSSYVSDPYGTSETGSKRRSKSSYETVELASDEKTPLRMKDGEFVFIDEESCIGCTACASACPSSFLMLESGRARTFKQRRASDVSTAISVCPVNCMHKVGFEELKEMETARDRGDGRSDHRHLGHRRGHTPLSVAGIDSDANHKSSWYHYLKQKCYSKWAGTVATADHCSRVLTRLCYCYFDITASSDCPKRGCYDCPNFRNPGDNPYFKAKEKKALELRVKDMMANGDADIYRRTAEL